jgi:hypothetical protein
MKLFLYWLAILALCLYALSPLTAALWAWWIFFYSPPHDPTLRLLIGCIMAFMPILTGPAILLVRYLWPRR